MQKLMEAKRNYKFCWQNTFNAMKATRIDFKWFGLAVWIIRNECKNFILASLVFVAISKAIVWFWNLFKY